jgi:hypothetical protein
VDVIAYDGKVAIVPSEGMDAVQCEVGMKLEEGARIMTDKDSWLDIAFDIDARNTVTVKENSEVVLKLEAEDKIELIDGELFAVVKELKKGEGFRVRTPCATCGARGTGWNTMTDGKITDIAVTDGEVFVRGINIDGSVMKKEYLIRKGYERRVKKFEKPGRLEKISRERLNILRDIRRPIKSLQPARTAEDLKEPVSRIDEARESIISRESAISEKLRTYDRTIDAKPIEPVKPIMMERMDEDRDRVIERRENISDRQDAITDKMDKMINREGSIERRIDRREDLKETYQDTILERKDDQRIDGLINTDGSSDNTR